MEMNRLGEYVQTNLNANPRIRSFHFNKIPLPPPISRWSDLVQAFLEANVEMSYGNPTPLKEFLNLELDEPFRLDESEDVREIIMMNDDVPKIESRFIRVCSLDRQKDHFWCVIRDYKPNRDSVLQHASRLESELEILESLER